MHIDIREIREKPLRPWLVQRIDKPRALPKEGVKNLVSWTKTTKAWLAENSESYAAMNALCPLDYMGAAEYEMGAVAEALRAIIACRKELVNFTCVLEGFPKSWVPIGKKKLEKFRKKVTLNGWCFPEHMKGLVEFLNQEADYDTRERNLKEPSEIQASCFGQCYENGYKVRELTVRNSNIITGWLDLCNLWFVGRDDAQVMWLKYLLGLGDPPKGVA